MNDLNRLQVKVNKSYDTSILRSFKKIGTPSINATSQSSFSPRLKNQQKKTVTFSNSKFQHEKTPKRTNTVMTNKNTWDYKGFYEDVDSRMY